MLGTLSYFGVLGTSQAVRHPPSLCELRRDKSALIRRTGHGLTISIELEGLSQAKISRDANRSDAFNTL
jgi:hypothetical protein